MREVGKRFAYEIWGAVYPGGKERETADRPYCGETSCSEMISQSISVYKVDEDGNVISK